MSMRQMFRRSRASADNTQPATGAHNDDDQVPTVIRGRAGDEVHGPYYELPRQAQVDLEVRARLLAALQMLPDDSAKADALNWTIRQSGLELTSVQSEDP